jgi:hypothetical protein
MRKPKPLSSHQRRIAGHWLAYYRPIMARPVRGVITYGGGLAVLQWIADSEAQGFHCTMTPAGVVLR